MAVNDHDKIQQYIERYTDIILHILGMEDPRYEGINQYRKLHDMVIAHYDKIGRPVTDFESFTMVKEAVSELAEKFLKSGTHFHDLHSADVRELVEPVLAKHIGKT